VITVLIGHRGVGKTTLLRRLEPLFLHKQGFVLRDLDAEIEDLHRRSIDSIFQYLGEAEFRKFETSTFEHLYREHDQASHLILAVGAGFEFQIPHDVRVIWIRRSTDSQGRVFFDRPALGDKDPLTIWHERFTAREEKYRRLAHAELTLPEGSLHDTILEEHFFGKNIKRLPYSLSALPENFKTSEFFSDRLHWGLKSLEIRDDLLTTLQITRLQETWPTESLLYSVRKAPMSTRPMAGTVDWPVEFAKPNFAVEILSLHERAKSLKETLTRFPASSDAILKLAVPIESFAELLEGHLWWQQEPKKRAFLPASTSGRWQWYRQLFGPQMPIHFFREGDGTSLDQPLLWQTLTHLDLANGFAAILGSPIRHSWTPSFQREFFDHHKIPVVAIEIGESEWDEAMPVLQTLGLKYAAVTSPHKLNAFMLAGTHVSEEAKRFSSVNTLVLTEEGWLGHNTDLKGLKALLSDELQEEIPIAVWGGGGTKEMLKDQLPKAQFVSARQGQELTEKTQVVWAVGRRKPFVWPKPANLVQTVIDLNYSEDSPGREIALQAGCPYKSGETMFIHQGLAQQEFWKRFL
jgi:shikimate 5-dehydrogenase/shikimate kinase